MLSRRAVQDYLDKPLDSYVWLKKLPRQQILDEIKHFKVKPVFKGHDRWTHQLACFFIGLCCPEFAFMLDMGLGKTAIALDIMTQLLREGLIQHSLVTVPRLVNLDTWDADCAQHSELEPTLVEGTVEDKWELLSNPRGQLTVIDYAGLQLACCKKEKIEGRNRLVRDDKKIAKLHKIYQLFLGDEIHKAKNQDSLRFSLLRQLTKHMEYRFGLTGTPFGRDPMALWAQFFLIDRGETFGESIGTFKEAFFNEVTGWGRTFEFDKQMTHTLHRRMQHRSIRYSEDEVPEAEIPKVMPLRVPLKFTQEQREHYLRAVDGLVLAQGSLREQDAAFLRMREITSGYMRWKDDDDDSHMVMFERNPKLEAIERIVDECHSKIVISTEYTASGRIIVNRLQHLGYKVEWLYGMSKNPRACVQNFIHDPDTTVLVMNSESGGTGTDGLQHVCNYLVFYESPVSPITRKQTLKRIARPGQKRRSFIIDLVMERSIDLRVLEFIEEGNSLHEAVVNGRISRGMLI